MAKDNSVLSGVAMVERLGTLIHGDDRIMLDRNALMSIKQFASIALSKVGATGDGILLDSLHTVSEIIDLILADESASTIDDVTKQMLAEKAASACSRVYSAAAKYYYEDHEFDYSPQVDAILRRIVEGAIRNGFYFGRVAS